jgi:hypothetical protein
VALFPPQFVLLHLPSIYNVPHKIQGITGVVLEEIVKSFGFAVPCAQVYITDKNRAISLFHTSIYAEMRYNFITILVIFGSLNTV